MANTRFNGPILFGNAQKWRNDAAQGFNLDMIRVFDDFTAVAVDSTNAWTVVKDSSASVAIVADTAGGEIALTSAATTDNDGASIQGNEIFLPAAGKNIWFEARVKMSSVADMDAFVGLSQNFATNPEAVLTASNRIGFQINDGDASILCKTEAADSETSTDSGVDGVDATYIRLGFLVRGTTGVEFYVNRQLVATHSTNIPTTELAIALFELSGSVTGTRSLTCDYVWAEANR